MSALGDRLRRVPIPGSYDDVSRSFDYAARVADEHEAAALAESAQGRGPHAAAVLRWAAGRMDHDDWCHYKSHGACCGWGPEDCDCHVSSLARWAEEAERAQDPTLAAFAAQGGGS